MQRSSEVLRSAGVGARSLAARADSDASTQAPDLQRTASASSSTSSNQASDLDDNGSDSDSGSSHGSMSPLAHSPSAPAPPRQRAVPLPPPMVLLQDVDHLVLPFDWRHRAPPKQPFYDSAPTTQSSDSSEATTASATSAASAAATHRSPRLRPRRQPLSPIPPMSPLTSSSAPWHHRHHDSPSRASTSDAQELLSRRGSDSSIWRSGPVSYAPTPAAGEFLSPVLSPIAGSSLDLSDHAARNAAAGDGIDSTSGSAGRPGEMSPGAVDAVDVAGALALLPGESRRPSLRLEGLPLPTAVTSASSSAISLLHGVPWVDQSPEPMDDNQRAPWSKQGQSSSPWSSPEASTLSHRMVRSPSMVSQRSVASDSSDVQQMDQSMMSSVSLISQHSAVSSETRRLSSWHEDMARRLTASEGHSFETEPGETTPRDDLSSDSRDPSDIEYFRDPDAASEVSEHEAQPVANDADDDADDDADEYLIEANDVRIFDHDRAERVACANSAAATLRSLLLPTPLTHVPHCLSRGKDHLAVLVPSGHGASTLQVLWLGAPERALAPVTTLSHASRLPLRWGLSIAPPLGRRGAVPPPVVGEHPVDEAPGCTLVAALFSPEGPPKTRLAQFQQQYVLGFVTASRATGADAAPGTDEVVWHSGPGLIAQWRQPLKAVRQPQVQISPLGSALLVVSATPKPDPFGISRVLDGVWLYVRQEVQPADADVGLDGKVKKAYRWVLREAESLVPKGSTTPTFAWTRDDQCTVMVGEQGVRFFDTHFAELRQELHLPLPKELAVPGGRIAAGPVSFDLEQRNVAVNWTTHGVGGEPRLRMAQVMRLDTARGVAHLPPKRAETWTTAAPPHPYEMIHFIGNRGDALWARAHDSKLIFRPKPLEAPNVANARTYGGATETFTQDHKHLLVPLGADQTMVAMLSPGRMRLYISYGPTSRPAQRRFVFAEKRPAMLQALRQRGVQPSPNRLTLAPWFEAEERFMYLGFDADVLQRYDLLPNQGRLPPVLVQPKQQGVATYDPQKTFWTQNHMPQ